MNAASLRMDLSGLGDSRAIAKPSSSPGEPNTPRGVFDLSAAMDHLRDRYEINQFVPIGLCSGALHTHLMAERSDQVVGAVMIDGIAFRTTGFYLRHYLFRMLFPSFWYGAIQRRRLDALPPSNPETNPAEFFYSESIGRETASQQIRQMKRDGKRLMFVFTGGCDDVNSAAQFRSMFGVSPDQRALTMHYRAAAEHTFRLRENQIWLCKTIANWWKTHWPVERGNVAGAVVVDA
ncbi:MAG: hypothetical protein AAFP69_09420 [Planctomycetota bacterium]